jgi:anti-sigma-K factor RskA
MALTATVDLSKTPATLTVVSDKRVVAVSVQAAGETATGTATYPVTVTDTSGRTWTVASDDGKTAVYTG